MSLLSPKRTAGFFAVVVSLVAVNAALAQESLPWQRGSSGAQGGYVTAGGSGDAYQQNGNYQTNGGNPSNGSSQSSGNYQSNGGYPSNGSSQSSGNYQSNGGNPSNGSSQSSGNYQSNGGYPSNGSSQSSGNYQSNGGYQPNGSTQSNGGYQPNDAYRPSASYGDRRDSFSDPGAPAANGGAGYGDPYAPPPGDGAGFGPPPQGGPATYEQGEVIGAGHRFFGAVSQSLASAVEWAFKSQGRPNGYILGEDAGGALILGLRYGEGRLYTKDAGEHKVYWQGPSIGYDAGAEGSKTMVLVYNLRDPSEIYNRFGGAQGAVYVVGGVSVQIQAYGEVTLAVIRSGVGLRLGANVGYLKYTRSPTWNPL